MARTVTIERSTSETQIRLILSVEGVGNRRISTGIPFFDHMLALFARHGFFGLEISAQGDIEVDFHHTVEDVGIVLGSAFSQALGDKTGVTRYGWSYVPMDETLVRAVVDLSGRPFLAYHAPRGVEPSGTFSFELVEEFLRAFATNAGITLHVEILYGRNSHHMAEGVFKALARAMDMATRLDPRVEGIPSTKGLL